MIQEMCMIFFIHENYLDLNHHNARIEILKLYEFYVSERIDNLNWSIDEGYNISETK